MRYDLEGRVAIVTGASRGIGRGIALEMARSGAIVVGTYVKHAKAAGAALKEVRAAGGDAEIVRADVSVEDDVIALRDRVLDSYGKVDHVVNNAGIHSTSSRGSCRSRTGTASSRRT
ncbi:MAG: SDR family NAD(P)-dependent oxidoreductase [Thermoplasmata archaeon]|nr:SDR family NAD(P)-dependent oxidoreductase [Thermoplasmata archaeon]